jgi:hypothetical protein
MYSIKSLRQLKKSGPFSWDFCEGLKPPGRKTCFVVLYRTSDFDGILERSNYIFTYFVELEILSGP